MFFSVHHLHYLLPLCTSFNSHDSTLTNPWGLVVCTLSMCLPPEAVSPDHVTSSDLSCSTWSSKLLHLAQAGLQTQTHQHLPVESGMFILQKKQYQPMPHRHVIWQQVVSSNMQTDHSPHLMLNDIDWETARFHWNEAVWQTVPCQYELHTMGRNQLLSKFMETTLDLWISNICCKVAHSLDKKDFQ